MKRISFAAVLGLALAAAGCGRSGRQELIVYAGAGLMPPVQEALDRFSAEHHVLIKPIPSGSGLLLAQITTTRRGDVYIPGDEFYMKQAADAGFVVSQKDVAFFVPVIAVAKGNPHGVRTLADLTDPKLRVGLGEPEHCAVGRISKLILQKQGLFEKVKPKYTASGVPELGNAVAMGSVDAAIIWDAIARFHPNDVDVVPIPPQENVIVAIPVGVLSFSKNPELARALQDYLASPVGREIFARNGYTVENPESKGPR